MENPDVGFSEYSGTGEQEHSTENSTRIHEGKWLKVQRYVINILHAYHCKDANCKNINCNKMKQVIQVKTRLQDLICVICTEKLVSCCCHARQYEKLKPGSLIPSVTTKKKLQSEQLAEQAQIKQTQNTTAHPKLNGVFQPSSSQSSLAAESHLFNETLKINSGNLNLSVTTKKKLQSQQLSEQAQIKQSQNTTAHPKLNGVFQPSSSQSSPAAESRIFNEPLKINSGNLIPSVTTKKNLQSQQLVEQAQIKQSQNTAAHPKLNGAIQPSSSQPSPAAGSRFFSQPLKINSGIPSVTTRKKWQLQIAEEAQRKQSQNTTAHPKLNGVLEPSSSQPSLAAESHLFNQTLKSNSGRLIPSVTTKKKLQSQQLAEEAQIKQSQNAAAYSMLNGASSSPSSPTARSHLFNQPLEANSDQMQAQEQLQQAHTFETQDHSVTAMSSDIIQPICESTDSTTQCADESHLQNPPLHAVERIWRQLPSPTEEADYELPKSLHDVLYSKYGIDLKKSSKSETKLNKQESKINYRFGPLPTRKVDYNLPNNCLKLLFGKYGIDLKKSRTEAKLSKKHAAKEKKAKAAKEKKAKQCSTKKRSRTSSPVVKGKSGSQKRARLEKSSKKSTPAPKKRCR